MKLFSFKFNAGRKLIRSNADSPSPQRKNGTDKYFRGVIEPIPGVLDPDPGVLDPDPGVVDPNPGVLDQDPGV